MAPALRVVPKNPPLGVTRRSFGIPNIVPRALIGGFLCTTEAT
jgi:hypothetical protein